MIEVAIANGFSITSLRTLKAHKKINGTVKTDVLISPFNITINTTISLIMRSEISCIFRIEHKAVQNFEFVFVHKPFLYCNDLTTTQGIRTPPPRPGGGISALVREE
jgi:hypothetical protein